MTAPDPSTSPTPDTAPAAPVRTRRQRMAHMARRAARWSAWGLLALVLAVTLLGVGLWQWSARDQSLATVLRIIQGYLPAHMALQADGVSGTVRQGGHIRRLVWTSQGIDADGYTGGELVMTFDNVQIEWELAALWDRATRFQKVEVQTATLQDTRMAKPLTAPKQPLQSLTLPISVELPFRIDTLRIVGQPDTENIRAQSPEQAQGKAEQAKREERQQEQARRTERLQAPPVAAPASALIASAAQLAASAVKEGKLDLQTEAAPPRPTRDTVLTRIAGNYRYDRITAEHQLQLDALTVANGTYQGKARLDGRAPMRTEISANGLLTLPASSTMPEQHLQAHTDINGTLSGIDALLNVEASVAPADAAAATATAGQGTRVQVQAGVHPWRTQPLAHARAQWQQLDVQAFVSSAPRTRLQGRLTLEPVSEGATASVAASAPAGTASAPSASSNIQAPGMLGFLGDKRWQATLQAQNDDSGALDKGLLPVRQLDAELHYYHGALDIRRLLLDQGPAGGRLQGQGQYRPAQGWIGDIEVQRLNPGLIDSRFAATPISGKLQAHAPLNDAQQLATAPIDFSVLLRSEGGSRAKGLALDVIDLQGRWHTQTLTLSRLLARARDTALQGSASYALPAQSGTADLTLALPGTTGKIKGSIGADNGQGTLQLAVGNLQQTLQWLQQWPGTEGLRQQQASGSLSLDATWRGGWQNNGRNMQVQGKLVAPVVSLRQAGQPDSATWFIRDTQLGINGTLANAAIDARSQAQQGTRDIRLALRGNAGKLAQGWRADLQATQLQLADTLQNKQWQASLVQPVQIRLQQDSNTLQASTSALRIQLGGSVPGQAFIAAEPIRYVQSGNSHTLSSKGQLGDIPLEWLDALMSSSISGSGLAGDMALAGNWDVQLGSTMRVHAVVERSKGDLTVLASDVGGRGRVSAGVRQARLELQGNGGNLQTRLQWDSVNAGTASALLTTRLSPSGSGWTLPANAPLGGSLQANLPRMGIWSIFAPPGWRLRGTLQANTTFGGTLQAPLVYGTLQADNLGVRSVVEGIEFSHGTLRTRINGQRLDIDALTLQGPAANRLPGGTVNMGGSVSWGGGGSLLQSLRVSLNTQLNRLQVSSMPERQIMLSGTVNTQLADLRLSMRGDIRVDRALIELPSTGGAPKLDTDVVIKPSARHPRAALAQTAQRASAAVTPPDAASDIVLKPGRNAASAPPAPAARTAGTTGAAGSVAKGGQTAPAANTEVRAVQQDPRVRAGTRQTNATIAPDIQIGIDMGDDFRVRGLGLDTRLRGRLQVQNGATLQSLPRLTGTIRTDRGTFRAYGQDLQIERGRIDFLNALDNPNLDITAIRPNLGSDMRVGVRIRGTAQLPLVQLFSDPAMPDSEKLSWLVLGRSSTGAADAALLQQAALSLLAGSGGGITGGLADAFGLDELSFNGAKDGSVAGGSMLVGKRFSRNFYMSYEHGLNAAMGTLYFFYDINRRLRLRGQTGEYTGIDLIYTWNYDRAF